MTKIVFVNIVDGSNDDYKKLQFILSSINKDKHYEFVVSPKQIESVSLDEIKNLVEEFEHDKHENSEDNAERPSLDEDQDRGTEQLEEKA